jgi:hypothetical protein
MSGASSVCVGLDFRPRGLGWGVVRKTRRAGQFRTTPPTLEAPDMQDPDVGADILDSVVERGEEA